MPLNEQSITWTDCRGNVHDLTTAKRISTHIAAQRLGFGDDTLLAMIRKGMLFPILKHNARRIEVYECAISDYLARKLQAAK